MASLFYVLCPMRTFLLLSVLALPLLLVAGCKSRGMDAATCADKAKDLGRFEAQLASEGHHAVAGTGELAESALVPRPAPLVPWIKLTEDEVTIDGRLVVRTRDLLGPEYLTRKYLNLPGLEEHLHEFFSKAKRLQEMGGQTPVPKEVAILASPRAPWVALLPIVFSAQTVGARRVHFLVAGRSALAPPPPAHNTQYLKEVAGLTGAGSPAAAGGPRSARPKPIFEDCPAAQRLLQATSAMNPEEAAQLRATRLPKAIEGCGCKVDFDAAKNWLWAMHGRFSGPPTAHFTLELAPSDKPAARVAASPLTPWAEIWSRVEETSRTGGSVTLDLLDPGPEKRLQQGSDRG